MSTVWRFWLAIQAPTGFLAHIVYQIQGRALTDRQAMVVGYGGKVVGVAFWTVVLYLLFALRDITVMALQPRSR
jgi:hypothetical protein